MMKFISAALIMFCLTSCTSAARYPSEFKYLSGGPAEIIQPDSGAPYMPLLVQDLASGEKMTVPLCSYSSWLPDASHCYSMDPESINKKDNCFIGTLKEIPCP